MSFAAFRLHINDYQANVFSREFQKLLWVHEPPPSINRLEKVHTLFVNYRTRARLKYVSSKNFSGGSEMSSNLNKASILFLLMQSQDPERSNQVLFFRSPRLHVGR